MPDIEGLLNRFSTLAVEIGRVADQGKKILIVTHIDADGLSSGSIAFAALMRARANVTVRSVPDLDKKLISTLGEDKFDFYIFTDLGSSLLSELTAALDGRYLVIDHHQLPEDDLANPNVVNAWQFGIDGGTGACSSTMAYFFARAMAGSNRDLAYLAVVGAVADRQDGGGGRSLTDLNRRALEDAMSGGLVSANRDFVLGQGDSAGPRSRGTDLLSVHAGIDRKQGRGPGGAREVRVQSQRGREVADGLRALVRRKDEAH